MKAVVLPASVEHLPGMTRCHQAAFPGQPMTILGSRWLAALYAYYVNHPAGVALVAVAPDHTVVGLAVGGDPAIRSDFLRTARWRYAPLLLSRVLTSAVIRGRAVRGLAQLLRRTRGPTTTAAEREAGLLGVRLGSLLSIGVLPEARGSGCAGALLTAFAEHCRARGFGYVELSVLANNTRAVAFYEKHGWQRLEHDGLSVHFGLRLVDQQHSNESVKH